MNRVGPAYFQSARFRREIVIPSINEFSLDPTNIRKALMAVWAVEALIAHYSHELNGKNGFYESNTRSRDIEFRKHLRATSDFAWRYLSLLNAISTAGKHGVKSGAAPIIQSLENIEIAERDGWAAYFDATPFWGEQLCVKLNVTFCEDRKQWVDMEGNCWRVIFNNPTVMKALTASMGVLDEWVEEAQGEAPEHAFNISVQDIKERYREIRGG